MQRDLSALRKAEDAFLDVAFSDNGWTDALNTLAAAAGAKGASVLRLPEAMQGSGPINGPFPVSSGLADFSRTYLNQGWIDADTRYKGMPTMIRRGICTDFDFASAKMIGRDPFYQEFIHVNGFGYFAGLRLDVNGNICCVSILREYGAPPFTADECRALLAAAPRLASATALIGELDRARTRGLTDAIDVMTTPCFLLSANGTVLGYNGAADCLLGKSIVLRHRRLCYPDRDSSDLEKYIFHLVASDEDNYARSARPFVLKRDPAMPLLLRGHRVRSEPALAYFRSAWAMITIVDPESRRDAAGDTLRAMFGLTEKEISILRALYHADGDTALTAATAQIAYETFRTHIKNIHLKTSTRTIAQLISLVGRIAQS